MSAYFFSPSSWVSLTQLRNFKRPQGYPSIPQGFPTSILQDIPTSILQVIPTSIPQGFPTSILQDIPTSVLQDIPTSILQDIPTSVLQDIPTSVLQDIPTSVLQDIPTGTLQGFPTSIAQSYPSITDNSQQALQHQLKNGYHVPTEWICKTFLVLFSISTVIHTVQAIRSRLWWLFPTAIFCGVLELAGWSGRLWSASHSTSLQTPFIIYWQLVNLVVAPTPLLAVNFILLGCIIRRLGPQYSRLTSRQYAIVFVSSDLTSLIVQGIGAIVAGSAGPSGSQKLPRLGSHIALGGATFQLISITMYCALAIEFLVHYTQGRPVRRSAPVQGEVLRGTTDKHLHRMVRAMIIMTILIAIRTIYRVAEFANSTGKVVSTQWIFNVFDGTMIVLAMYTLNLFHPGIYLREQDYPSQTSSVENLKPTDHESVVSSAS